MIKLNIKAAVYNWLYLHKYWSEWQTRRKSNYSHAYHIIKKATFINMSGKTIIYKFFKDLLRIEKRLTGWKFLVINFYPLFLTQLPQMWFSTMWKRFFQTHTEKISLWEWKFRLKVLQNTVGNSFFRGIMNN